MTEPVSDRHQRVTTARSLQRSLALRRRLGDATRSAMRALPGRLSGHGVTPICTQGFLFLRPMRPPSCAGPSISATSSTQCCRTGASHVASDGLIWPKDGCASIACAATAAVRLSSPGLRPFLARQESLTAAILRCASARRWVRRRSPSACRSPSRPRWSRARTPRVPGRDRHPERPDQGRPHRPRDQPGQRKRPQPSGLCRPRRDRGRLVEALQRGPRLPLGQAGRSELHRPDLRQPRRGRRDLQPHLVPQPQAERRVSWDRQ